MTFSSWWLERGYLHKNTISFSHFSHIIWIDLQKQISYTDLLKTCQSADKLSSLGCDGQTESERGEGGQRRFDWGRPKQPAHRSACWCSWPSSRTTWHQRAMEKMKRVPRSIQNQLKRKLAKRLTCRKEKPMATPPIMPKFLRRKLVTFSKHPWRKEEEIKTQQWSLSPILSSVNGREWETTGSTYINIDVIGSLWWPGQAGVNTIVHTAARGRHAVALAFTAPVNGEPVSVGGIATALQLYGSNKQVTHSQSIKTEKRGLTPDCSPSMDLRLVSSDEYFFMASSSPVLKPSSNCKKTTADFSFHCMVHLNHMWTAATEQTQSSLVLHRIKIITLCEGSDACLTSWNHTVHTCYADASQETAQHAKTVSGGSVVQAMLELHSRNFIPERKSINWDSGCKQS